MIKSRLTQQLKSCDTGFVFTLFCLKTFWQKIPKRSTGKGHCRVRLLMNFRWLKNWSQKCGFLLGYMRTGCKWAPECLEVLRARGLPCATRHRHIPRLSSSNIETRPGHVLVTPSHLLSCHTRLVLIFLTCSSSPPLTAKICVPYIFPRLGVLRTPSSNCTFLTFKVSWYTLVNQKRNYVKDLRLSTFFGIMHLWKSVKGKISMTITTMTFFTPLTHNYDPYLLSCPQRAQRLIGLRLSLP